MRITFVSPVVSHVRFRKRAEALKRLGAQSKHLAFERDYYPGKLWPGGFTSLGWLEHGHYHKRFIPLIKALPVVRAAARESDVIYAFGLDMLLLGWLACRTLPKRPKIVYEVGDIREVLLSDSFFSRVLRCLERAVLRRVNLLVVTSEAFVTGYYQGIQGLTGLRYQVIENKVDAPALAQPRPQTEYDQWEGVLRIGAFGVIRCQRSLEILKRVAERGHGRVEVYVRGIPMGIAMERLLEEAQAIPHIDYGGPFVSPDDLPILYGGVAMVWASYPYQGAGVGNWRWARTNRFYESCFFGRPMLAQAGTEDGRVVETFGLGVCLDLADVEGNVDRILQIGKPEIHQWRQNVAKLPKEVYVYSGEHKQLYEAIQ